MFRLRARYFLRVQKVPKDTLKNPWFLRISFHGDLGADTAPFGAAKSNGLSPACCRPLAGTVAPVRPTGERLTMVGTWGGVQDAGESGTRPCKGAGSGGYDRPSPLEKGAVAAKGGDWGFLVSCRGTEKDGGRNPPSRLRRATSLFKGGFWRADNVRPYEGARRGRRAPRMGSSIPKPCPRTDGAQRRGCRGIGQTLRSSTRSPSRRPNAESLRSPLHRSARWQVPRQAHFAGADGPDHRSSQAPVGRERERAPFDPLAPIVTAGLPLRVPRPPSMGVLRGSGA